MLSAMVVTAYGEVDVRFVSELSATKREGAALRRGGRSIKMWAGRGRTYRALRLVVILPLTAA